MSAPYGYTPPAYPPQYPNTPPAPAYPQQYAPPPAPGYPPVQLAPPAPALVPGSLDDFFTQPSTGGGKAISFTTIGQTYTGIVPRPLGSGDVQQQTDTQQRPQFFKDGRAKFVMKVPLQMQPSAEFPDGLATWYVKGQARDELVRAMAEAGAPPGPPEAGAIIQVTHTGTRPSGAGMNPAKLVAVVYRRPDGAGPAPVAQQPPAPLADFGKDFGPAPGPAPQPQYAPPPAPAAYAPPQPSQAPVAQPGGPADLTPEQRALLAKLTGS